MVIASPVSPVASLGKLGSLVEILKYRAAHQPNQICYEYLRRGELVDDSLNYQALQKRAQTIAFHLKSVGARGGRALLLFSPGLDFISAFFGCLYAGVTAVPAYPPRKNKKMLRLQAIVRDADATVVLTTADLFEKVSCWYDQDSPLGQIPWLTTDMLAEENFEESSSPHPLAFLQYTSGSTGTPKGVVVSQANLMHNLGAIYECFGHNSRSKGVIWLPPYHDMGLIGGVLQPLYGGFAVTLMSPVDFLQKPLRWLQAISTHRATTSGGPDFAYDLCVNKAKALLARDGGAEWLQQLDLSSWEVAFTGAEPVRSDTLARFSETFAPYGFRPEAFYPCYGMAETTLIVSGGSASTKPNILRVNAENLAKHRVETVEEERIQSSSTQTLVSCGAGLHDQEIMIVHLETKFPCSAGEVGEIWVRGESVAQGYWRDARKTKDSFDAYLALAKSEIADGAGPFLRTGDLGFLHAGELYITGRIKDMMIIRGVNYYPHDIEGAVEDSHEALKAGAIAAFSIEIRGAERLVIVAEVERTFVRKLNVKAVLENIRRAIAAQYALQLYAGLIVRPGQIPKTSSGKIQRYRCREMFLAGELAVVNDWSESPTHKTEFVKINSEVDSLLETVGVREK